jgi:hypothetical protein
MRELDPDKRAELLEELASGWLGTNSSEADARDMEGADPEPSDKTGFVWEIWAIGLIVLALIANGIFRFLELLGA